MNTQKRNPIYKGIGMARLSSNGEKKDLATISVDSVLSIMDFIAETAPVFASYNYLPNAGIIAHDWSSGRAGDSIINTEIMFCLLGKKILDEGFMKDVEADFNETVTSKEEVQKLCNRYGVEFHEFISTLEQATVFLDKIIRAFKNELGEIHRLTLEKTPFKCLHLPPFPVDEIIPMVFFGEMPGYLLPFQAVNAIRKGTSVEDFTTYWSGMADMEAEDEKEKQERLYQVTVLLSEIQANINSPYNLIGLSKMSNAQKMFPCVHPVVFYAGRSIACLMEKAPASRLAELSEKFQQMLVEAEADIAQRAKEENYIGAIHMASEGLNDIARNFVPALAQTGGIDGKSEAMIARLVALMAIPNLSPVDNVFSTRLLELLDEAIYKDL